MELFLHIGYPKCFSTTLQRGYFSKHEDIYYGGVGIESNIDFLSDDLNLLFESGIIYFNRYLFNKELPTFHKSVDKFLDSAKTSGRRIAGFSSEHLIFNFSPQGVDYRDKVDRIITLFGNDLKIIMILRKQSDLIISLYKEYVRMGYLYSFPEFIEWLFKYQDRNFYYELMYSEVVKYLLSKGILSDNIFIRWFEDYKNANVNNIGKLYDELSDFLAIKKTKLDISFFNRSLEDPLIKKKTLINNSIRFDFGETHLEGIENHRRRIFFNNYLKMNYTEDKLFENVKKKRLSLDILDDGDSLEVSNNSTIENRERHIGWSSISSKLKNRILDNFEKNNNQMLELMKEHSI